MTATDGNGGRRSTGPASSAPEPSAWHALPVADACAALGADEHGLGADEVAARQSRFGPNAMPHAPPPSWLRIAARQFRSPVISILGVAAVVSIAIGHTTDAAFIAGVVAINALIGGVQEYRAERSARALQQLLRMRASVVRDGEVSEVDAEAVVPGDVVWLESGFRVPADLRLLGTRGLEVDESLLTGESIAVVKDAEAVFAESTSVGDRMNLAFAGSMVTRGRAKGLVVATGASTEVGRLALDVMGAVAGQPPLLVRLSRFTHVVGVAVFVAALVIAAIGVLAQHYAASDMFLFAVALVVSAIPEGLPVAITVALAVGASRMARRGVIVRTLSAVEGLGSCTLIASDKTGTLTCNELTVRTIETAAGDAYVVTGEGFAPVGEIRSGAETIGRGTDGALDALLLAAVLVNEADLHLRDESWVWRGDPTDIALLSAARKAGWVRETALDERPQIAQIAFEPELRFAASFHREHGTPVVLVKGAPERVLGMCRSDGVAEEHRPLRERAEALAEAGYRVLAFARGTLDTEPPSDAVPPEPADLEFLGLVGMIDPLRHGVRDAIAECRRAGIAVSMVTGDHPVTALAIARDLGFADAPEQVMTGEALAELEPAALERRVGTTRVFARVAPGQKLDIVEAAQRAGHFVAVTGDGANDAPALRAANIGVAMGRGGTDVARESSDLVISDDNLATIVAGVEEGRVAYDNIRKVILLLVATGAAEVLLVTLAIASGMPLPLLPAQLLWLNLVTNGIQDVALAFEPAERDVLRRQPRPPRERIFNRVMIWNCAMIAVVMGGAAFAAFRWMLAAGWSEGSARNGLLLLMVLFENVLIGCCRSEVGSALRLSPLRSPFLLAGALAALAVHVMAMHLPIGAAVLGTEPVGPAVWAWCLAVALGVFWVIELHKLVLRRRLGASATTAGAA